MIMSARPLPPRPIVLVVDDEAPIRDVLQLALEPHFDVETAASANEAELMMGTRSYDVIVCDHLMPDEEGLAFLTRARTQFPKVQRFWRKNERRNDHDNRRHANANSNDLRPGAQKWVPVELPVPRLRR